MDNIAMSLNGRLLINDGDLETQGDDRGVILMSPDGCRWVQQVDNNGIGSWVKISSSPEVDMSERRSRKAAKIAQIAQDITDWNAAGQLQDKVNKLAEHVGLKVRA